MGTMPEPTQVLVVVLDLSTNPAMAAITKLVEEAIPQDSRMDVWAIGINDPLIGTIRAVNCSLFTTDSRNGRQGG